MMKVWGMLSTEEEEDGFEVIMDDERQVVLLSENETLARFDPRDYTATELYSEIGARLRWIRGETDQMQ
ncbi:MAG: hypothetical protein R6U37_10080 [Dehalococcoidia bacterium]